LLDNDSKIENRYLYTISVDNKKRLRNGELIKEFTFPGGINIRQTIKKRFSREYACPMFDEDELPKLYEFIESLEPK
jgi:hypothetical protein